jgi:predicted Zn-dependent peptidase
MRHQVKEITLKNGARGLLLHVPAATVMVGTFNFRAGFRFAKRRELYDAPHLLEHLSFAANKDYASEQDYELALAQNGAYHNATTGENIIDYDFACADFEWQRVLSLLSLGICAPVYQSAKIKTEKQVIKNELADNLNNYPRRLWQRIDVAMGEQFLLDRQRCQYLPKITLAALKEHYQRTHTSDNLRFVLAGNLRSREEELRQQLEAWPLARGQYLKPMADKLRAASPIFVERTESKNLDFCLTLNCPGRLTAAEETALECLQQILTGTSYSLIFGAARERGLTYDVYSSVHYSFASSSWDFEGSVTLDQAETLLTLIVAALKQVLAGELKASDLAAAKSFMLGRYQMSYQTPGAVSDYYQGRYFSVGEIEDFRGEPKRIKAVTVAQMTAVARKFFASNIWGFGGIGRKQRALIKHLHQIVATLF